MCTLRRFPNGDFQLAMSETEQKRAYPFVAIVGQQAMKRGLLLNVIHPGVGGLLLMGDRGTGKSTAVRGLAQLMPSLEQIAGCRIHCEPGCPAPCCGHESAPDGSDRTERVAVPVVDLPLGATEDRVAGSLDLEAALVRGEASFEPGLLGRAHRGFLYIDEVNLLEDHLVDLLLDVAASGHNVVEREAISVQHAARFVLIGSGNPEEGELRPQLLDRFGLSVQVSSELDVPARVEITRRRLAWERDPVAFAEHYASETRALAERIEAARERVASVRIGDEFLERIAELNAELEIAGHRGDLAMARAACAWAAFENRSSVTPADVRAVAAPALAHRLRSDPLDAEPSDERVDEAVERLFGDAG